MNRLNLSIFNVIKERDGMLMRQLYEMLPENGRVSYSYFRDWVEKNRTSVGVLRKKPFSRSNSVFLTANRHISDRKMMLMILIAEWELKEGYLANWYRPSRELFNVHLDFLSLVPRGDLGSPISNQVRDMKLSTILEKLYWVKETTENQHKRLEIQRKKRLNYPVSDEEIKAASGVKEGRFTFKGIPFTYDGRKPENTIYSLYASGIFVELVPTLCNIGYTAVWHVFDIENNLTSEKFSEAVKDILGFMVDNCYTEVKFSINVYTWNESRKRVYKNIHKIDKSIFLTGKWEGARRNPQWDKMESLFVGIEFINLNADRYFNTFRSSKRRKDGGVMVDSGKAP